MFLWNVEKCVQIFEKVYVSSDSEEILQLAKEHGAIPITRGEELCGDVPDIPVFQHAMEHMDCTGLVAVHADTPLIDPDLIRTAKHLIELGVPEVMTCHPMTHGKDYKKQHNKVYGSIRGFSKERLETYQDPYRPNPEILLVDPSPEIETEEDLQQYG